MSALYWVPMIETHNKKLYVRYSFLKDCFGGRYIFRNSLIESIKTTSKEDVSTRVLEKIKNILEGKTEKWSDVSRHI